MVVVAGIGVASFVLVSLVLGVRLVRLSRRTQELPELAMGLAFLLCGGVGYGQVLAGQVALESHPHLTPLLLASGSLMVDLGACCLAIFTWRVFRPGRLGVALFAALSVAVLVSFVGQAVAGDFDEPGLNSAYAWAAIGTLGATFVWPGLESFHYYALLRRRERVGLSDPALARTFWWWGCGAASASLIYATIPVVVLFGVEDLTHPAAAVPTAIFGGFSAFSVAKAFARERSSRAGLQRSSSSPRAGA